MQDLRLLLSKMPTTSHRGGEGAHLSGGLDSSKLTVAHNKSDHVGSICSMSGISADYAGPWAPFKQNAHQLGFVAHHVHLSFQAKMSDEPQLAPYPRL